MKREQIYKVIDSEREYQQRLHEEERDKKLSVAEWITYIEYQIGKAKKSIYEGSNLLALERVRKIGALAVACMENQGGRERKQ